MNGIFWIGVIIAVVIGGGGVLLAVLRRDKTD